ncbi:CoA protein activase [Desulfofundulus sp. TPOSR]|uniref:acyl-CoA dehydratase activase-related protein n=1 Tax=Desulfofundulus sp. TPOSR TaxID=2714340 RepID=UPI00140D2CEA|nr:acyl-CoA dehydratase activase-related protein [Desulfofundulus sp. TPOSR]NHM27911.1 CoA protein activase [Desulfofundulus sp. TPOSR]
MKVTFPHMGHMWICLAAMLEYLGVEVVVPPPTSKRTLTLGARHAPEFACLPLKLNLGNFIEAAERGADTILMAGGCGPCRFGYYAQVEHAILEDLGYNYRLVVMEPPQKHVGELLSRIKYITGHSSWWEVVRGIRFGYQKARMVDELERQAHYLRPRESHRGSTDKAFQRALQEIIAVKHPRDLPKAAERARKIMAGVAIKPRPVLRVGIVGEIFTLLESFANHDLERKLGYLGVQADRSIYLSEWINDHLFLGLVRGLRSRREACRAAPPYLNHFVGGHGQETVGSTVIYARQGYDGVIQLLPFTCMPEIVAHSVLPGLSSELDIPTLTITVDEQSGEAGLVTRLEAFVDLLARKRGVVV